MNRKIVAIAVYFLMVLSPNYLVAQEIRHPIDDMKDSQDKVRLEDNIRANSAIQVKVGSFTCPASTGTTSITDIGFKPRYVEFRGGVASATVANIGSGWMDYNGNQGSWSIAGKDDLQITNVDPVRCIVITDESNSNVVSATYVSMDKEGFTIQFEITSNTYGVLYKAVR